MIKSPADLPLGESILVCVLWILLFAVPLLGFLWLVFFLLSLPLRRKERANLFLDLLEDALASGERIEDRIVSLCNSRDNGLGIYLHLLAAHLENGLTLMDALKKIPRLLPPPVTAMLSAGERVGDISKVIPACRKLLADGLSQTRGAVNYLVILFFVVGPLMVLVMWSLHLFILPKFERIFEEMLEGKPFPAFAQLTFGLSPFIFIAVIFVTVIPYAGAFFYIGGPMLVARWRLKPAADRIFFRIPWRRKRLVRDFSTMLSLLLDAGVPESEAVTIAAGVTTNSVLILKSQKIVEALQSGTRLTEAMAAFDDTGEFKWRLTNASHTHSNFHRALDGWHESLDARAFQQEQAAAHLLTTAFVVFNGIVIGMYCVSIFLIMNKIIREVGT